MPDKLEAYNSEVRDQWIAKSLGLKFQALKKHKYFVASDENSKILIVTFVPSIDPDFLIRLPENDGTGIFSIDNQ